MNKTNEERISELENVLEQMLKPIKNIPFRVIVKSLAGCDVIPFDADNPQDVKMLIGVESAIRCCASEVKLNPIIRSRPNEVGNDIEPFVRRALALQGFQVESPKAQNGTTKGVGYPDILMFDQSNRATYIECKTYHIASENSTMRSFFLSPSDSFKVCRDARHLVVSFEMVSTAVPGSRDSCYTALGFKIVDVAGLLCDVKYEFNSDNRRLYDNRIVLKQGLFS